MLRRIALIAVLLMLGIAVQAQESPTPTPETVEYHVQSGDTLGIIAARFGTSISAIMRQNELSNAELIVIGQTLLIPVAAPESDTGATPIPIEPIVEVTNEPEMPIPFETPTPPAFSFGVEAFFDGQDTGSVVQQITTLAMRWTKIRVSWRTIETFPGSPDFGSLDTAVDALQLAGLNVLLTITDAPDWSRSSALENGPPDDFSTYTTFVSTLATRYAGRVQAYEIWNEPNLRREWNSIVNPLGADNYAALLRGAYTAIKSVDPAATVVSAGLAPTGFNDGVNALDDRLYLARLYQLGLADMSDAVGAHPYGFANPPDAICCGATDSVLTHFGHPSFYFLDTLNDYRQIMTASGDSAAQLWATQFGWGTSEDRALPRNNLYVRYNTPDEQAAYIAHAFELGERTGYVGVMIAYNLNGCLAQPANVEACYYSLVAPSGQPRPAFQMLSGMFSEVPIPAPIVG